MGLSPRPWPDATASAEAIRRGDTSAAELVDLAIAGAERVNPQLNAIVTETFEAAREQAAAEVGGEFAGIPTFIKDTDNLRGAPTLMGSRAMPRKPATHSSAFVEQMLATGLVCLGKTSMPEFGLTATTEPLGFGPTRNPWNPDYSTGASSGGSAALVAAGVVSIAHANDGGGSIRIPASCCGLVGLKPTRARLHDAEGTERLPINFIVQGVVTRTVRDTAAFLAAAERIHRNPRLPALGDVRGPGRERLRIGLFTRNIDGQESAAECVEATQTVAATLRTLGHEVREIEPPFDRRMADDFFVFWGLIPFALRHLGRRGIDRDFDPAMLDDWTCGLATVFRRNLLRVPVVFRRMRKFARTYDEIFTDLDLLLSPTLGHQPPRIGAMSPEVPFETALARVRRFAAFTPVQNIAGAPAISIPAALSPDGLPVGVQLAAACGEDRRLLEIAYELEEALAWKHRRPPVSVRD